MEKNNKSNTQYCAITEQGDLGLGADILNQKDQKILKEQFESQKSDKIQHTEKNHK